MKNAVGQRVVGGFTLLTFSLSTFILPTKISYAQSAQDQSQNSTAVRTIQNIGQMCYAKFGQDDIYKTKLIETVFGITPKKMELTDDQKNQFDSNIALLNATSAKANAKIKNFREKLFDDLITYQVASSIFLHEKYSSSHDEAYYNTYFTNEDRFRYADTAFYRIMLKKIVAGVMSDLEQAPVSKVDFDSKEILKSIATINQKAKNIRNACESIKSPVPVRDAESTRPVGFKPFLKNTNNNDYILTAEQKNYLVTELSPIVTTPFTDLLYSEMQLNPNECKFQGGDMNFFSLPISANNLKNKSVTIQDAVDEGVNKLAKNYEEEPAYKFIEKVINTVPEGVQTILYTSGSVEHAQIACDAIGSIYKTKKNHDWRVGTGIIAGLLAAPVTLVVAGNTALVVVAWSVAVDLTVGIAGAFVFFNQKNEMEDRIENQEAIRKFAATFIKPKPLASISRRGY